MKIKKIPKGKPLAAGEEVTGRYKVLGWVGEGGMQDVYLASDEAFGGQVVLKFPKNASAERRFLRSAKIAAQINHPNVAKTLDYVMVEDFGYLIEEFIDGDDLKATRANMPLMDPYLAAHVGHHIAKGLAASHRAGVTHRDLKPSNIMVPAGLDIATVKITDFGIAKMAEAELAQIDEETITSSSTMAGALPYMAPEMLKGAANGKPASDVWALGAMIFEFFSGDKPFGKNLDAVELIRRADVPPLPAIAKKAQFRGIAEELYAIVESCLSKDASDRPTADALVDRFANLCYPVARRCEGTVTGVRFGSQFFAETELGTVFFHLDSVYGPSPRVGSRVSMAVYPGNPWPRAHPIVQLS